MADTAGIPDEAVKAGYDALNSGPKGVVIYEKEVRAILAAALPVLREQIAAEIEAQFADGHVVAVLAALADPAGDVQPP